MSCQEPALSIHAELEPGLRVLSPKQEVCDEVGRKQSLSAEEETLDEGWQGARRAVAADGPLQGDSLWESIQALKATLW